MRLHGTETIAPDETLVGLDAACGPRNSQELLIWDTAAVGESEH